MPLKPHPTDPDKMVFVKREYNLPKEWVGLTDEEINILFKNSLNSVPAGVIWNISRTIEAKLKEKNT